MIPHDETPKLLDFTSPSPCVLDILEPHLTQHGLCLLHVLHIIVHEHKHNGLGVLLYQRRKVLLRINSVMQQYQNVGGEKQRMSSMKM